VYFRGCFVTNKRGEAMRGERKGEGEEKRLEGLDPDNVWDGLKPVTWQ